MVWERDYQHRSQAAVLGGLGTRLYRSISLSVPGHAHMYMHTIYQSSAASLDSTHSLVSASSGC